jgi:hypothetical protein
LIAATRPQKIGQIRRRRSVAIIVLSGVIEYPENSLIAGKKPALR